MDVIKRLTEDRDNLVSNRGGSTAERHATKSGLPALRSKTGEMVMEATVLLTTFIAVFAASGLVTAYWYAK